MNGQNVATVDPGMLDMILKTDQLNLVVRSMRPSTAPCLQCNNAAAAVASGAMMLGAGHHGMHGIIAHSGITLIRLNCTHEIWREITTSCTENPDRMPTQFQYLASLNQH